MNSHAQRCTIQLPAELHERLSDWAREAERSLSAEIRVAIREHVRREPRTLAVFALLRADAEHFSKVSTRAQAAAMRGVTEGELTDSLAAWDGSPEDEARKERERKRLQAPRRMRNTVAPMTNVANVTTPQLTITFAGLASPRARASRLLHLTRISYHHSRRR